MYDDSERKINWLTVIKRILLIIIAIIVILILISFVTRCSRNLKNNNNNNNNNVVNPEPVSLKTELDNVQNATLKYLTKDNLPTEINGVKTVKLKYLINKNLIGTVKDSDGTICDVNNSYSEITRLENNYAVRTTLSCGKNTDYKIVYIGCFDNCKDGEICVGSEDSKNGICSVQPVDNTIKNDTPAQTTTNTTNTNTSTTQTTTKTTSPAKTTTSNTSQTTTTNIPKIAYEYKKCVSKQVCESGTLGSNNKCYSISIKTYTGNVVENTYTTYTTSTVAANKNVSTNIIYLKTPSSAQNTSTVTYTYLGYDSKYGYKYEKKETSYSCSNGTLNGTTCTISTPHTNTTYGCDSEGYFYNAETNTCKKTVSKEVYTDPITNTTCETMWSYQTEVPGWTRTGNTKLE